MTDAIDKAAADFMREMLAGIEAGTLAVVAFAAADNPEEYSCTVRCSERRMVETEPPKPTSTSAPPPAGCEFCGAPLLRFESGTSCSDVKCGAQFDPPPDTEP
jgi:hypothetical protein